MHPKQERKPTICLMKDLSQLRKTSSLSLMTQNRVKTQGQAMKVYLNVTYVSNQLKNLLLLHVATCTVGNAYTNGLINQIELLFAQFVKVELTRRS